MTAGLRRERQRRGARESGHPAPAVRRLGQFEAAAPLRL